MTTDADEYTLITDDMLYGSGKALNFIHNCFAAFGIVMCMQYPYLFGIVSYCVAMIYAITPFHFNALAATRF